jgi:RNA polymerase sigma-70 factor (ECF subfamily)
MQEAAETVARALEGLNLDLREIVELKTYAGLTFQQIGQVTGLPQGTVATRYRSAVAKMQSWLGRQTL